jgi:hypothetical protein
MVYLVALVVVLVLDIWALVALVVLVQLIRGTQVAPVRLATESLVMVAVLVLLVFQALLEGLKPLVLHLLFLEHL